MYHKIKKKVETYKFGTWEKVKHELYPLFMDSTLVLIGLG